MTSALLKELISDEMERVNLKIEDSNAHIFCCFNSGLLASANNERSIRDELERRLRVLAETLEVLVRSA